MYGIGGAGGPVFVGVVSDLLKSRTGAASLGYAMMAATPFLFWSALHFQLAARSLREDLGGD
jgi:hypothetical protein